MAVLFNFTKTYDPKVSFSIASIVILGIGMYFTSQVVDVSTNNTHSENSDEFVTESGTI